MVHSWPRWAVLLILCAWICAACDTGTPTATPQPPAATVTSQPAAATNTAAPTDATNTTAPPATNTSAPPAATATVAPGPVPAVGQLTDTSILAALQTAGLPIAEIIVYTADTDPNKLLGRPNQYIAKASWHDSRLPAPTDPKAPEVSDGGGLEIYPDAAGAAARGAYIAGIGKASPLFAEYDYLYGPIVLRLSHSLTPTQAADYTKAMDTISGSPGATPVIVP